MRQYQQEGLLYLALSKNRVIGFGAMLPLAKALPEEIVTRLKNTGLNINDTWYSADLGVNQKFRNKGIGTNLVKVRLDAVKGKTVVMRTSIDNKNSQSIYRSLGFQQIPNLIQTVDGRRQDGSIQPDTRIFFVKKIV
ncbi:MAG: GCN5-related N-acetyltransferase [uncultured bacterium]|nr:MAG: GCN5-related N-acetyltransferase [uncultured bacterium]